MQARLATSLAHLLEADDIARAYGTYGGAAVLLEQACDPELAEAEPPAWERALEALQRVVKSCKERQDKNSTSFVPAPPEEKVLHLSLRMHRSMPSSQSPTVMLPRWRSAHLGAISAVRMGLTAGDSGLHIETSCASSGGRTTLTMVLMQVYIGKGYVNNPRVHDVVFVVEGAPFYAHKLALSASSETFRAMFDSGYLEGGTGIPEIQIPNLSRRVFEAMMMFVYTGEAGISDHLDILPELLQARSSL